MLGYLSYETYLSSRLKVLDLGDDGPPAQQHHHRHAPPPEEPTPPVSPPSPQDESEPMPVLDPFTGGAGDVQGLRLMGFDGSEEYGEGASMMSTTLGWREEEEAPVMRRVSTGSSSGRYCAPPSDDEEEEEEGEGEGHYEYEPMDYYGEQGPEEEEEEAGEEEEEEEEEVVLEEEEVEVDRVADLSRYAEERRQADLRRQNRAAVLGLERAEEDADLMMEEEEAALGAEGALEGGGEEEDGDRPAAPWMAQLSRLRRRLRHRDAELERICEADMNGLLKRQREEREAKEREQREKEQRERERRGKLESLAAWTQDPSVPLERVERRLTQEGLQPVTPDEHAMVAAARDLLRQAASLDAALGDLLQAFAEDKNKAAGDGEALKQAAARLAEGVKGLPGWASLKARMGEGPRLFPHVASFLQQLSDIRKCLLWKPPPPPPPTAVATPAPASSAVPSAAAPSTPAQPPPQAAGTGGAAAAGAGGVGGGLSVWVSEVEGSVLRMREWGEALGVEGASDEWDQALIEVMNLVAVDRVAMASGAEKVLRLLQQAKAKGGAQGALSFVWSFVRYAVAHPDGQQGLLRQTFPFHSHRALQEDVRKDWSDFDLVWYARLLLAFCMVLGTDHVVLPSGQKLDAADVVVGALAQYVPFVVPTRPEWLDLSEAETVLLTTAMDKCQRVGFKDVFKIKNRGVNQVKVVLKLLAQTMMTLTSRHQAAQLQADVGSWCPAALSQPPGRLPFDAQSMYYWLVAFTRSLDAKRRKQSEEGRPFAMATALELFALGTFLAHEVPVEATMLSPRHRPVPDVPEKKTECTTFFLQLQRTGTVAVLRERMGDHCLLPFCRVLVDVAYRPFLDFVLDEAAFKLPPTKLEAPHWRLVLLRYLGDWVQPPPAICFCRQPGCIQPATHYPACNFVDRSGKALGGAPPCPPVLALCDRDKSLSTMNEAVGVHLLKKVKDRIKTK